MVLVESITFEDMTIGKGARVTLDDGTAVELHEIQSFQDERMPRFILESLGVDKTLYLVDFAKMKRLVLSSFGQDRHDDEGMISIADLLDRCDAQDYEAVSHPVHYNSHPSGVECITIIQEFCANVAMAVKHLWRAGLKPDTSAIEDLHKAKRYIDFEIERLQQERKKYQDRDCGNCDDCNDMSNGYCSRFEYVPGRCHFDCDNCAYIVDTEKCPKRQEEARQAASGEKS